MRKICLLGASGSIGEQTLDILRNNADFELISFSVWNNTSCIKTILENFPNVSKVCVKEAESASLLKEKYPHIEFFHGSIGILKLINNDVDIVVNAIVGFAGLEPTLEALKANKILCLANKESLVVGGELVNKLLKQGKGKIYPIDSEHSAIYKCLSVDNKKVRRLLLTASGGPFLHKKRDELNSVTPEDALKHPTWSMGSKITIDSATMINKTFEVIEAYYLFGYNFNHINILINEESLIHSLVEYCNKTYRLDYSKPDMHRPIELALYEYKKDFETYLVKRCKSFKDSKLVPLDKKRFPVIKYAKLTINKKGSYGAVLNAVNEVAVRAFLNKQITFLDIESIISKVIKQHKVVKHPTYEKLLEIDQNTRVLTEKLIKGGHTR